MEFPGIYSSSILESPEEDSLSDSNVENPYIDFLNETRSSGNASGNESEDEKEEEDDKSGVYTPIPTRQKSLNIRSRSQTVHQYSQDDVNQFHYQSSLMRSSIVSLSLPEDLNKIQSENFPIESDNGMDNEGYEVGDDEVFEESGDELEKPINKFAPIDIELTAPTPPPKKKKVNRASRISVKLKFSADVLFGDMFRKKSDERKDCASCKPERKVSILTEIANKKQSSEFSSRFLKYRINADKNHYTSSPNLGRRRSGTNPV